MEQKRNVRRWGTAVLAAVLLAAAVLTFPYALGLTWSLPGTADRTLTYTPGSLKWDFAADIDSNGVIRLHMFKSDYGNVRSTDGENLVAPGTGNNTSVRLLNKAPGAVSYTAVLYRLDDTDVPIEASLTGASNVSRYALPGGVDAYQVVDAIGGTLSGGSAEVLDIDWLWRQSADGEYDPHDTALGDESVPDKVEYGLYVVVTDNNYDATVIPDTGDSSDRLLWLILAVTSLCTAVAIAVWGLRTKKHEG